MRSLRQASTASAIPCRRCRHNRPQPLPLLCPRPARPGPLSLQEILEALEKRLPESLKHRVTPLLAGHAP